MDKKSLRRERAFFANGDCKCAGSPGHFFNLAPVVHKKQQPPKLSCHIMFIRMAKMHFHTNTNILELEWKECLFMRPTNQRHFRIRSSGRRGITLELRGQFQNIVMSLNTLHGPFNTPSPFVSKCCTLYTIVNWTNKMSFYLWGQPSSFCTASLVNFEIVLPHY